MKMAFIVKKLLVISCLLLLTTNSSAANADEYLKLLENEAEQTKIDSGENVESVIKNTTTKKTATENNPEKKWQGKCGLLETPLPPNLQHKEFTSYLKKCAVGSYVFYQRLSQISKYSVYDKYKKNINIKMDNLREYILKKY